MNKQTDPPIGKDGKRMKRFELRRRLLGSGKWDRAIFIDGQKFDFSIDKNSLMQAAQMGNEYFKAAQKDIQKYFIDSLSEVLNRKVTTEEISQAQKTGWI
jgi:hypothetical protein